MCPPPGDGRQPPHAELVFSHGYDQQHTTGRQPGRLNHQETITVTCDIEFTDVEVNAMNLLHLRYSLQCQIFDKDFWERKPVAVLDEWTFPKITETTVSKNEHVVFNTDRPITDLHTHFLSNDQLQAELTLRNEETGQVEAVSRTDYISVDLVA